MEYSHKITFKKFKLLKKKENNDNNENGQRYTFIVRSHVYKYFRLII